ncbi:KAP family NTPase [Streptomyces sp. NBC_00147]
MAQPRPWIIEDSAIQSHDQDRFDHLSVAQELSTIVRHSHRPLAVGLLGPFGSGKSSVVRLLDAELKGDKNWAVVHLSAERHTGTARARGLLYGMLDDLERQGLITEKICRSERACLESGRQRVDSRPTHTADRPGEPSKIMYAKAAGGALGWMAATLGLIWLLGVLVVLIGHRFDLGTGISPWSWFTAPGAGPMTAVVFSAAVVANVLGTAKEGAQAVLKRYDITLTTPRPESTDDLEQVFARLISTIKQRLVIAIDDIDRLPATEVLEALATVRSLLLTGTHQEHAPVFLLSCDEDIVREAIVGVRPGLAHRSAPAPSGNDPAQSAQPERKATEEAAQEYLNKLFTVRLALPAHHGGDLRDYAERLLTHPVEHDIVANLGGMQQTQDVLDLLIHPDVQDPRHVIRLLNGFLTDYALAVRREKPHADGIPRIAPGEVTRFPLTLARLTILRHDFPRLYDEIRAEHELLTVLDDALLGSATALNDPLLAPFTQPAAAQDDTTDSQPTARRMNMTATPGLSYLLATADRTRLLRPAHLTPLLTLGSTPASRHLGSEQAAAIHRELIQRDADAFAARLANEPGRHRVLDAAAHTLTHARNGIDLDNALTAAIQALVRIPALTEHADQDAPTSRALQNLTATIARRRDTATTPPAAHDLIAALDLFPAPYLPALYGSLSTPPPTNHEAPADAEQPAFRWAKALITLPEGTHTAHLRPALTDYLLDLASSGSLSELKTWITFYDEATPLQRAVWPPQAYQALLAMTALVQDHATARDVHRITHEAAGQHQWQRPVLEGVLTWLNTDDNMLRTQAVELLGRAEVPEDGWGYPAAKPAAPGDSSLAAQLIEQAAKFLDDDESATSSQTTAHLLHTWLPVIGDHTSTTPDTLVSTVIARAIGQTAQTCIELATAATSLMADLPDHDAAHCATTIAENLNSPDLTDEAVRDALAESLITCLRRAEHSTDPDLTQSAAASLNALTVSLNQPDAQGGRSRHYLPAVLTTQQGRAAAPGFADQLIQVINPYNQPQAADALDSLRTLFHAPATRDAKLPSTMQHLNNWTSGNLIPAVVFAAHHAEHTAVNTTWLNLIAQHWHQLPDPAHTAALSAASRDDLNQTPLPTLLAQHIRTRDTPTVWAHTNDLWDKLDADQHAALLAAADGRCPALATRADAADPATLDTALTTASAEQLPQLLRLLADSKPFTDAVCLHVDRSLGDREWDTPRMTAIAAACPDKTALWDVLLEQTETDQSTLSHLISIIGVLIETAPETVPDSCTEQMAPALQTATPTNAAALGTAVRPINNLAKELARALRGQGRTAEGKARTTAFKTAAGL